MIERFAAEFPVKDLCLALEISRSGYYQWRKRVPGKRIRANERLLEHIKETFEESRQTYGSPRITQQLRRRDIRCGQNRVARLMRGHNIKARSKRPFRPRTTQSGHCEPVAPNHLKHTSPVGPDQIWTADITYIRTAAGYWVYLAAVMDLWSRKIVGWSVGLSLETILVKEALKQALAMRRPAPGLLHHSDRGIQYASSAFRALLGNYQIVPSMSASGNCYDNAAMESFWSTLKTELGCDFQDIDAARLAIFDYIETFYNRKRLHSALGFQSPAEFEHTTKCDQN